MTHAGSGFTKVADNFRNCRTQEEKLLAELRLQVEKIAQQHDQSENQLKAVAGLQASLQ